jgi:hypothetical protein
MLARVCSFVGPAVVGVVEVEVEVEVVEVCGFVSRAGVAALVEVLAVVVVVAVWGGDLGTGRDIPRSFPRLATPTPQVSVVRYPVQSLPNSIH